MSDSEGARCASVKSIIDVTFRAPSSTSMLAEVPSPCTTQRVAKCDRCSAARAGRYRLSPSHTAVGRLPSAVHRGAARRVRPASRRHEDAPASHQRIPVPNHPKGAVYPVGMKEPPRSHRRQRPGWSRRAVGLAPVRGIRILQTLQELMEPRNMRKTRLRRIDQQRETAQDHLARAVLEWIAMNALARSSRMLEGSK
jgi:hypothetical protein